MVTEAVTRRALQKTLLENFAIFTVKHRHRCFTVNIATFQEYLF